MRGGVRVLVPRYLTVVAKRREGGRREAECEEESEERGRAGWPPTAGTAVCGSS